MAAVEQREPVSAEPDLERLAQLFEEAVTAAMERTTAIEIEALLDRSEASLALSFDTGLRAPIAKANDRPRIRLQVVRVDDSGLDEEARSAPGARSSGVTPDWIPLERARRGRAVPDPGPAKVR